MIRAGGVCWSLGGTRGGMWGGTVPSPCLTPPRQAAQALPGVRGDDDGTGDTGQHLGDKGGGGGESHGGRGQRLLLLLGGGQSRGRRRGGRWGRQGAGRV